MSELRVGVVGAGLMGSDHIARIETRIAGARVTAIIDTDAGRLADAQLIAPASAGFPSVEEAISSGEIDAVIVATPGQFHLPVLLPVLKAGLPILCEKPLTTDVESALEVLAAEQLAGGKLIQVGFMRRFDRGYMELREIIASQEHGDLLALRCAHRNPSVPKGYTNEMLINDSVVHEIDTVRFLTDSPIAAIEVKHLKRNSTNYPHLRDPILALLETESGVVADVEMNVSVKFGYQVKTEAVFENGIVEIGRTSGATVWSNGRYSGTEHTTFKTRFAEAYDLQIQRWVNATRVGTIDGPSAWDGYLVAAACEAGVQALNTGRRIEVTYASKPAFYDD